MILSMFKAEAKALWQCFQRQSYMGRKFTWINEWINNELENQQNAREESEEEEECTSQERTIESAPTANKGDIIISVLSNLLVYLS